MFHTLAISPKNDTCKVHNWDALHILKPETSTEVSAENVKTTEAPETAQTTETSETTETAETNPGRFPHFGFSLWNCGSIRICFNV